MVKMTKLVTVAMALAALVTSTATVGAAPSARRPAPADTTVADTTPLASDPAATAQRPDSPEAAEHAPSPRPAREPAVATAPAPALDIAAIQVLIDERRAALAEVEARHAAQVAAAVAAAREAAEEAEAAARFRLDAAAVTVAEADAVVAQERARLDTTRSERRAAQQRLRDALRRIRSVAVGGFAGAVDPIDPMGAAMFGDRDLADATSTTVYATAAARAAVGEVHRSTKAERDAARAVEQQRSAVEDARKVLSTTQDELARVSAALDATLIANEVAIATAAMIPPPPELLVTGPELGSIAGVGGPTILGPSLVPAEDLAAFVLARGRPHPSIDIDELAQLFVSEGTLEGVAGDIAWVQAIIETGWFSFRGSMVHAADHNYAGIGACDSCRRGFVFGSPLDGARAQMQLLRIYATPGLRSDDLANPPVRTVPERLSVRGCCGTWMELSGVWATGPGYGIKILSLYNELLSFSAARR